MSKPIDREVMVSAFQLAIFAKRLGAQFEYRDGQIVALGLELLPLQLRCEIRRRLSDVLAVIAEHSVPSDVRPSDAIDAARLIVTRTSPARA
jgi:hypothetical protein